MYHLYEMLASYVGRERVNGTVRVLFKTRLIFQIFSRINGPIKFRVKGQLMCCHIRKKVNLKRMYPLI